MTREKIVSRVQKLIAKAESTEHEAEKDAFYAKAQHLMLAYAVEQHELDDAQREDKIVERYLFWATQRAAGKQDKWRVFRQIVEGNSVQWLHRTERIVNGVRGTYIKCVGFESDLDFCELLYTSLMLECDTACRDALKYKRPAWEHQRTYQLNFVAGFATRIVERIKNMQREAREQFKQIEAPTVSASLEMVLVSKRDKITSYLDDQNLKVRESYRRANHSGYSASARQEGRTAADRADLSAGRTKRVGQRKALEA